MLMWIIVICLLLIGLALIIVELVFVPGTTIIGLLGLIFVVAGIVISYRHFGNETGFYILTGTLVITLASLIWSFRGGAWSKFSLKTSIASKVNEGMVTALKIGDEGLTTSTLRPFGKAEFGGRQYEVKSAGDYMESGTRVRIKEINSNQIVVEPIN